MPEASRRTSAPNARADDDDVRVAIYRHFVAHASPSHLRDGGRTSSSREAPCSTSGRKSTWTNSVGNAASLAERCSRPGNSRARFERVTETDLAGILDFLRAAERLKTVTRSAYTSTGDRESVAEHTWRVSLMALLLAPEFPDVDFAKLVKICIVHDLGEAIGGDIPAPEQARRIAAGESAGKSADERRDLLTLVAPLAPALREEIVALWDEYEAARTPEAKLAKALDKLETILQHTQGRNPPEFDYRFNLGYGRAHTAEPPLIAAMRAVLDEATEARARQREMETESR
jgi:putative hydrolase of HD superfamily